MALTFRRRLSLALALNIMPLYSTVCSCLDKRNFACFLFVVFLKEFLKDFNLEAGGWPQPSPSRVDNDPLF